MILRRAEGDAPWKVIDMHCHVLPGLDDGSFDMRETLAMLRIAEREGISDMIVTPHFHMGRHEASPETITEVLEWVREAAAAEGISVKLYPGNEIFYFDGMGKYLQNRKILTLNGSGHVLIEFSPSVMFRSMQNAAEEAMYAGFQPVIAHVERYGCLVNSIDNVDQLRDMGALLQINASTVMGKVGGDRKKFVHRLLKDNAVSFVGTDAHGANHRTPEISRCRELIIKKYGNDYAKAIMNGNAMALLE